MDIKKYCIVCGNENFSRSKKFCCNKCQQAYYYQQNIDRLKEYKSNYYQEHKEEILERTDKWIKNNPDKHRAYNRKSYYNRLKKDNEINQGKE